MRPLFYMRSLDFPFWARVSILIDAVPIVSPLLCVSISMEKGYMHVQPLFFF